MPGAVCTGLCQSPEGQGSWARWSCQLPSHAWGLPTGPPGSLTLVTLPQLGRMQSGCLRMKALQLFHHPGAHATDGCRGHTPRSLETPGLHCWARCCRVGGLVWAAWAEPGSRVPESLPSTSRSSSPPGLFSFSVVSHCWVAPQSPRNKCPPGQAALSSEATSLADLAGVLARAVLASCSLCLSGNCPGHASSAGLVTASVDPLVCTVHLSSAHSLWWEPVSRGHALRAGLSQQGRSPLPCTYSCPAPHHVLGQNNLLVPLGSAVLHQEGSGSAPDVL